jgi:tRNA pseudouridine55 synthase
MENGTVEAPTLGEIKKKLDSLIPEYELPLPAFSAKKIAGKKSYDDARAGNIREEKKVMKVHGYEILMYEFPLLQIALDVGSGTYIRSIAYRLGQQLGIGGTLIQLRRTRIGDRDVETIKNWEELHNTYKDKEEIIRFAKQ